MDKYTIIIFLDPDCTRVHVSDFPYTDISTVLSIKDFFYVINTVSHHDSEILFEPAQRSCFLELSENFFWNCFSFQRRKKNALDTKVNPLRYTRTSKALFLESSRGCEWGYKYVALCETV